MEGNCFMAMRIYLGATKMFWNLTEVVVAHYCECTKYHWIVHFSMANFMLMTFTLIFKKIFMSV